MCKQAVALHNRRGMLKHVSHLDIRVLDEVFLLAAGYLHWWQSDYSFCISRITFPLARPPSWYSCASLQHKFTGLLPIKGTVFALNWPYNPQHKQCVTVASPDLSEHVIASVFDALQFSLYGIRVSVCIRDTVHDLVFCSAPSLRPFANESDTGTFQYRRKQYSKDFTAAQSLASTSTCSIRSDISCIHLPLGCTIMNLYWAPLPALPISVLYRNTTQSQSGSIARHAHARPRVASAT